MSWRNVDPLEYRKLAEAVAIRFPRSDRGAQALYWLALDTPLLQDRIDLLEHYKLPFGRSDSFPRELLNDAYLQTDLDKASPVDLASSLYIAGLKNARDRLRRGNPDEARIAIRLLEDVESPGLPPQMSHTPFYLMKAAARGELAGYQSLIEAMAKEPSDILRDALNHYGEKVGKTPAQIQADVRTKLLARATSAEPFELTGFDGAKVSLADYRGKVVLVNYWHPACAACRAEDPFLQQTLRKFGARQMAVLSVNVRAAEDVYVLPYLRGNGYYITPLHGDGGARDTPANVLIDQEGRIVYQRGAVRGAVDARELELHIETLLSHPDPGPLAPGDRVPDFAFIDLAGKHRDLHEYYGDVTLIDFCAACDAEAADMKKIATLRVADPTAGRLASELFGMKTLPARALIDAEGRLIGRVDKPGDLDSLLAGRVAGGR